MIIHFDIFVNSYLRTYHNVYLIEYVSYCMFYSKKHHKKYDNMNFRTNEIHKLNLHKYKKYNAHLSRNI
jgi:hypothetical protein